MKKLSFALIIFAVVAAALSAKPKTSKKMENTMTQEQLLDRMELRELVDRYAAESDKGNQEYYRNIFAKNLKLRIIAGENPLRRHLRENRRQVVDYRARPAHRVQ